MQATQSSEERKIERTLLTCREITRHQINKQLEFQKESKKKKNDEIIPPDFSNCKKIINHRFNNLKQLKKSKHKEKCIINLIIRRDNHRKFTENH